MLEPPYIIPPAKVRFLDRIMPTGKAWAPLWRLRYALLGQKRGITIENTIIDLTGRTPLPVLDILPPKPDFARSNTIRVWRLSNAEVSMLRKRGKEASDDHVLAVSRIMTGDESEAQIFSGNSILSNGKLQQAGLSVDLLPRFRKRATDLTLVVIYSEAVTNNSTLNAGVVQAGLVSVQTNFAFGARLQIPLESAGIFVLRTGPGLTNKEMGLLLTCQWLPRKK
jgi:hypothetical protein